jgi:hypothetical protein
MCEMERVWYYIDMFAVMYVVRFDDVTLRMQAEDCRDK